MYLSYKGLKGPHPKNVLSYFWSNFFNSLWWSLPVIFSDFRYILPFSSKKGSYGPNHKVNYFVFGTILKFYYEFSNFVLTSSCVHNKISMFKVSNTNITSTFAPTILGCTTAVVSCCTHYKGFFSVLTPSLLRSLRMDSANL